MSSTPTLETLPLTRFLSRPVLISGAAVFLAVALSWVWLFSHAAGMDRMPEAGAASRMSTMTGMILPWSADYLLTTFTMWSLMMIAMMLPSAAPMILLHARIDRGTQAQRTRDSSLFVACYLIVWTLFSAMATVAQAVLIDSGLLSSGNLVLNDNHIAGGLLIAAALWQMTSAKAACLEQCQSPLQFVLRYWRPGPAGALRLGLRHGLFCLGCCWSLMLILFVGGVMSLAWIAGLAAVVFIEKLAPPVWRAERWIAGFLISAAVVVLLI